MPSGTGYTRFCSDSVGVELRPLVPRHAVELASCVDNARDHLAPWTMLAARVTDAESARGLLEEYSDPPRCFGIWLENQLVGGALFRIYDTDSGICEVGGWLTPCAEGQGLITRAFRQLIDWAEEQGISRVELRSSPDNKRARAIAQRLGMNLEATHHQLFRLNGEWHDCEVWALECA